MLSRLHFKLKKEIETRSGPKLIEFHLQSVWSEPVVRPLLSGSADGVNFQRMRIERGMRGIYVNELAEKQKHRRRRTIGCYLRRHLVVILDCCEKSFLQAQGNGVTAVVNSSPTIRKYRIKQNVTVTERHEYVHSVHDCTDEAMRGRMFNVERDDGNSVKSIQIDMEPQSGSDSSDNFQ